MIGKFKGFFIVLGFFIVYYFLNQFVWFGDSFDLAIKALIILFLVTVIVSELKQIFNTKANQYIIDNIAGFKVYSMSEVKKRMTENFDEDNPPNMELDIHFSVNDTHYSITREVMKWKTKNWRKNKTACCEQ